MGCFSGINEAHYSYQAISDTVIITSTQRDEIIDYLKTLKKIQISFLEEQLFIRGGMTYSQHFKSGNVTYSQAIARAYELESTTAIYPRLVIDKNIIEMFKDTSEMKALKKSNLIACQNGTYFLNILDKRNVLKIKILCEQIYESQKPLLFEKETDFLKHQWFEKYILSFCDNHKVTMKRYLPPIEFKI